MFISARMKKVEILTLVSDEPQVTEAVGRMGVLHLTRAPAEGGALPLDSPESHESAARLETVLTRASELCEAVCVEAGEPPETTSYATVQEAEHDLDGIEAEVREILDERNALGVSRIQIEKLLRDTSIIRDIDAPVEQLEEMSFLHFAIGGMGGEAAAATQQELGDRAVVLPYRSPYGEKKVVAISSKKGRWALESALEKHGFKRDQLPDDETGVPARITELAEQRLEALLARTQELNDAVRTAAGEHGTKILAIRRRIRTELRMVEARANFAHTWATMLITGWIPADKVDALCETVLDITQQRAVIEVRDPQAGDDAPPTLMKNPSIFRPFEMLVSAYSTPHYGEIEPTPFIAVLFVLMFGVMFGDVGHSALLLLAGVLMWLKGRNKIRDAGVIMTFCAVSGMIFGAIFGSYFGIETVGSQHLGLPPLANAERLLALTVVFGVGVISLGIVLNIINRFRRREYAEGSFDKFGIVGGIFYWGSVTIAIRGIVTGGDVGWLPVALLVIAPLVLMVVYKPLIELRRRRPGGNGMVFVCVESVIEAFEAVLLYMANTLSFARIAAFALAHAGLSLAIFEVMAAVRAFPGGPIWAVCVFVIGTVVVLLLEGLIVGIQSMRLQYYEFFSKFFRGEGRRYAPFSLKSE